MFGDWENFYIIVAPAAGALIGLLFVVVTLTTENEPRGLEMGSRIYITPIVCHLAAVLVIGAMAAVPGIVPEVAGALFGTLGVLGVMYSVVTTMRLFALQRLNDYTPDLSDKLFYGIFPALIYAALAGAGGAFLIDVRVGEYALAAVTLLLLLLAIRDAWDLVTAVVKTLAKRKHEARNK